MRQVLLPESRRPVADMFDGPTIESAFATIAKEFGSTIRLLELTFDRDRLMVTPVLIPEDRIAVDSLQSARPYYEATQTHRTEVLTRDDASSGPSDGGY